MSRHGGFVFLIMANLDAGAVRLLWFHEGDGELGPRRKRSTVIMRHSIARYCKSPFHL